jgi:hypothetical protein
MSELMKIRLLAMIDSELKHVAGMISNETLWMHGSNTKDDQIIHMSNIADLEDYNSLLLRMREKVVEEEFDV